MDLYQISLTLYPIVMIVSVSLIIISFFIKNNNKKIFYMGTTIIGIYIVSLFAIVIPYLFSSIFLKDYADYIWFLIFPFAIWLTVSLIIQFKNRFIILINNEKEIYIRDIDVKYSPAVLSYLMNNKIETKKDLSATLLNLCANNVLKIEKDINGEITIIDLKNKKEIEKLFIDEKYAYEMLTTGITNSKILNWKNKVIEDYQKHKFSKPHKTSLYHYLMFLFVLLMIFPAFFSISQNIISTLLIIVFFSAYEISLFSTIKETITSNKKTEFVDTYTKKGAIEYNRWIKFEKFIEEYTLIKEKKFENIAILGKYLSYSIAIGINKKCDKELYNEINTNFGFDYEIIANMFEKNNQ